MSDGDMMTRKYDVNANERKNERKMWFEYEEILSMNIEPEFRVGWKINKDMQMWSRRDKTQSLSTIVLLQPHYLWMEPQTLNLRPLFYIHSDSVNTVMSKQRWQRFTKRHIRWAHGRSKHDVTNAKQTRKFATRQAERPSARMRPLKRVMWNWTENAPSETTLKSIDALIHPSCGSGINDQYSLVHRQYRPGHV